MRTRPMAKLGIFLTAVTVIVVAASAYAKRPGGGGGGQECLDVWDPVICSDGNVYSNLCYASKAGASGCVPFGDTLQAKRPGGGGGGQECLDVWDPVICSDGNVYSNLCYASKAGASGCVPFGDTLQAKRPPSGCPRPIECTMVWDPVICSDGNVYSNGCVAYQQCATGCSAYGDGGPVPVP